MLISVGAGYLFVCRAICLVPCMARNELSNARLGVGPDPPTLTQAFNQPAISGSEHSEAMFTNAVRRHEAVDLVQKGFAHALGLTRYCVHFNARYNVPHPRK